MLLVSSTQRICHQRRPQRQSQGSNGHIPRNGILEIRYTCVRQATGSRRPLASAEPWSLRKGPMDRAKWIEFRGSETDARKEFPKWIPLKISSFRRRIQNQTRKSERTLVERFDLDNRCAVVAADPKRAGVLRIVDIDAADVGRARQHVFRILAALDIKTCHMVG